MRQREANVVMHTSTEIGPELEPRRAPRRTRFRTGRAGAVLFMAIAAPLGLASACLDRPIGSPDPVTTNIYVDRIAQTSVDKIDLLFMIDNSRSMSDKQAILQQAVPDLVNRLVNPICVGPDG